MKMEEVSLKSGTKLGQLFESNVIPTGAEIYTKVNDLLDIMMEMYVNHHNHSKVINSPSFLEGPISLPRQS